MGLLGALHRAPEAPGGNRLARRGATGAAPRRARARHDAEPRALRGGLREPGASLPGGEPRGALGNPPLPGRRPGPARLDAQRHLLRLEASLDLRLRGVEARAGHGGVRARHGGRASVCRQRRGGSGCARRRGQGLSEPVRGGAEPRQCARARRSSAPGSSGSPLGPAGAPARPATSSGGRRPPPRPVPGTAMRTARRWWRGYPLR